MMRQRTAADAVHASRGDFRNRIDFDVSGCLQFDFRAGGVANGDCFSKLFPREIVQQHNIGIDRKHVAKLRD